MKRSRTCARKGCGHEFKMYKTTDKHCSPACFYADQEDKPKDKPKKRPKPIVYYSEKRKRESYRYSKKRKVFLARLKTPYCPVAKKIYNQLLICTEIHHKAGRRGWLLNYVPYWLGVSRKGHLWIHANPEEAYRLGFLIKSTTVHK